MEGTAVSQAEVVWCDYPVEGSNHLATTAAAPVQIELTNTDLARQLQQQFQVQYCNVAANQGPFILLPLAHQQAPIQHVVNVPQNMAVTTEADTIEQQADSAMNQVIIEVDLTKTAKLRPGGAVERVRCKACYKTFSCGANLRDHMRLHTGEKPYKCSECGMEFAQRSNWRLHKRVHTGERPYMCGICGKTFARSSHLPGHMRTHTGEKPFDCETCLKSFPSSQALKNHVRTHTGEKPYKCSYCETSFTHSSSLSSHKKKCNGIKRKRGRPIGTGRKPVKKKQPSGRPRGRPKKKVRSGRGRKKINPKTIEDQEDTDPLKIWPSPERICKEAGSIDSTDVSMIQISDVRSINDREPTVSVKNARGRVNSLNVSKDLIKPKLVIRESIRLRKKYEKKRANAEMLCNMKADENRVPYEHNEREQSIVVDFDNSHESSEEQQNIILEHNDDSTITEISSDGHSTFTNLNFNVASSGSNSAADQQEAAITMTTLHQQEVLNLTHFKAVNRVVSQHESVIGSTTFSTADGHHHSQGQAVLTIVNPVANLNDQALSILPVNSKNQSASAHSGQSSFRESSERNIDHLGMQPLSAQTGCITYQVNGSEVIVPLAASQTVSSLQPNW